MGLGWSNITSDEYEGGNLYGPDASQLAQLIAGIPPKDRNNMVIKGPQGAVNNLLRSGMFGQLMQEAELASGATAVGPGAMRSSNPAIDAQYDTIRRLREEKEKRRRKEEEARLRAEQAERAARWGIGS